MSATGHATLHLRVLGESHKVSIAVPPTPAEVGDVLSAAQLISDTTMAIAFEKTAAAGAPASCRRGCTACCHQLVGISAPEARAMARLVDGMPPDRQAVIRRRFDVTFAALRANRILDRESPDGAPVFLVDRHTTSDSDRHLDITRRYFNLHLPCPFLENGLCGIYADRPLTCREYAVTTPAELCGKLDMPGIEMVVPPVKLSVGLSQVTAAIERKPAVEIPLFAALAWAAMPENAAPERNVSGVDLLKLLVRWMDSQSNVPLDERSATAAKEESGKSHDVRLTAPDSATHHAPPP